MSLTRVNYPGDGTQRQFGIPFPYIDRTHVRVLVNLVPQLSPGDYYWLDDDTIEFRVAPPQGAVVCIYRETELATALVQYQSGSVLTERELNLAVLQSLYLTQETRDYYNALIDGRLAELAGGNTTAGAVIDRVVEEILNDQLLADLQQRINDIDTNAQAILANKVDITHLRSRVEELTNVSLEGLDTLIAEERVERINGDSALAQTLALIGARSGDSTAFVLNLGTVKVNPSESLAQRLDAITARFQSAEALIATEQNVRAAADSAFAGQLSTITSRVSAAEAAISSEQTARANADTALSNRLDSVTARVGTAEAAITAEQTARANADSALSSRVDGLLVQVNDNKALILTEQTARANGDSALAGQISTLQSSVNGNTASIQTLQQVVNGLAAQYMVKLDVNGYVAGFGLYNNGATSSFTVLADKFAVVTPGRSPQVPFAVDANGVYMPNAFIRNLTVDKITGGNITSQWNIVANNGRIVLDTGTHMKVIGVGFGANNDLVEWYGPKMEIAACTKANAITYVGMDGSAYFGGSLKAGTLYNAQRTTNTQVPTEVICGPYATNGKAKTIVISYSFSEQWRYSQMDQGGYSYSGTPYADIEIYRTVAGGTETRITTVRFTGDCQYLNEFDGPDSATISIGGSYTYTDNDPALGDRTYRAKIIVRNPGSLVHSSGNLGTRVSQSQSLSIVSTEQ